RRRFTLAYSVFLAAHRNAFLFQIVIQRERMLGAVPHAGCTLAPEGAKVSGTRAGNHEVRLFRLAVLEHAGALEHKGPGLATDSPGDPFEADESGRAVAPVHHQVFDLALTLDVTREALGYRRARESR